MQRRTFLASAAATGAAAVLNPSVSMAQASNPLLRTWTGPYGGVPAFDKVKVADFKPALEAAMARNLAEIAAPHGVEISVGVGTAALRAVLDGEGA